MLGTALASGCVVLDESKPDAGKLLRGGRAPKEKARAVKANFPGACSRFARGWVVNEESKPTAKKLLRWAEEKPPVAKVDCSAAGPLEPSMEKVFELITAMGECWLEFCGGLVDTSVRGWSPLRDPGLVWRRLREHDGAAPSLAAPAT